MQGCAAASGVPAVRVCSPIPRSWVHVLLALAVQGGSAGPINHGALFSGDLPKVQPPCRERGFPLSGLVGEKCRNIFPPYRQWPFAQQAGVPNC